MTMNMLDLLSIASPSGEATAVTLTDGRVLTYKELRILATHCRRSLQLPRKGLIAVNRPRELEGLACYLAALAEGQTVFLCEDSDPNLWEDFVNLYQPDVVVAKGLEALDALLKRAGYEHAADGEIPVWRRPAGYAGAIHPSLGMLIRTSGSIGSPKMVRLSYRNLSTNAMAICKALGLRGGDRISASLPMDFSFGLSLVNSAFAVGASIALCTWSASSDLFWQYADHVHSTCVGAVPVTYRFLRSSGWDPRDHPSLRLLLHAGGPLDDQTIRYYAARLPGPDGGFVAMYGQTEATARIACLAGSLAEAYAGSSGRVIPGSEITIQRPDGSLAGDGEEGEIIVRGPGVMMGYADQRDDLAAGDTQGSTLNTGDLGYLHEGLLYVTGRRDRQVKIFGRRVNLQEVEGAIAAYGVTAAAETTGEERILIVTDDPLGARRACREIGRKVGLPPGTLSVVPVQDLPRSRTGKTDYHAVRRILDSQQPKKFGDPGLTLRWSWLVSSYRR